MDKFPYIFKPGHKIDIWEKALTFEYHTWLMQSPHERHLAQMDVLNSP